MKVATKMVALGDVAELNPRLADTIQPSTQVSFVPMAAVTEVTGEIVREEMRPYVEVAKGFTPFKSDDVIIAKITPCFQNGKIAHAKLSQPWGFGSTEFHVVRADEKRLFPRYIFHYLRQDYIRVAGERRMTGSAGQRRVPKNYLAQLKIPLPPLSEQKRIAEILDRAEALRAKRRAALALLDELTQSIFLDMFGDPVTNERSWPTKSVSRLCTLVRGSSPRPKADPKYYGGPVPRLMVADITRDGWLVTPKIDSLTLEGAKKCRPVPAGTVVMAVSGNVGLVSQLPVDACVHDGFVAYTELNETICNPQYLLALLHFSKAVHEKSKAGAIFINLTTTDIKKMDIPIPSLELQHEFLRRMSTANELRSDVLEAIHTLDQLFASLQHRAFRGEL